MSLTRYKFFTIAVAFETVSDHHVNKKFAIPVFVRGKVYGANAPKVYPIHGPCIGLLQVLVHKHHKPPFPILLSSPRTKLIDHVHVFLLFLTCFCECKIYEECITLFREYGKTVTD